MEKKTQKIIKLKVNMRDKKGKMIPRGIIETLQAEIADGVATFRFKDSKTTKRFASFAMEMEKRRGANDTAYLPRFQKAVTKYEGKTKEEIRDLLLEQFKELGVNAK